MNVKLLSPNAVLPEYKSVMASGMDLTNCADYDCWLPPGETMKFPTGIAIELPRGWEGQIRPRSSMSAKGLNTPIGTIDADYRGQLWVVLQNVSNSFVFLEKGERIAQLVVTKVERLIPTVTSELSETARGEGGFGSTNKKCGC